MASQLTRDEVAHIADLARLDLSPAELDMFARQLADILAYAAAVQEADTSRVAPATETLPPASVWREDAPAASVERDIVTTEAPDAAREAGLFRVPKVL